MPPNSYNINIKNYITRIRNCQCHSEMKKLSEKRALEKLQKLKDEYKEFIGSNFEHRAKNCATCETKGACCLDEHFVNVHITRLEAVAIGNALTGFTMEKRREVYARIEDAIEKYGLSAAGDTFAKTYACPLFETGTGCLVHKEGKPLPCIQHACYERREDLPPDALLAEQQDRVETLNRRTYTEPVTWLPLPVALSIQKTSDIS